ncbi:DNA-directed RNA polymerase [Escovopsis weberi]|uniref:DNA-directed RNA polymerase n=1 Tax=Escovopsis weberi TaxID=150374 RepID=A0A0M8N6G8_ESCWE|nr:DNA-directed RNA polymerase [Escovopsis weberi]
MPLSVPEPPPGPRPAVKTNTYGVPGEIEDMLAVFDACLRVHKMDRAALVLKRLNAVSSLSGEQQIVLNNRYLRASLGQMRTTPNPEQAEKLHKWYELQIRGKSLPHTAETVACMLKASLLSQRGTRLERLVKRYMGMAPGEAGLRVLSMDDILSDQDLAVITDICPTYNYAADADEFEELQDLAPFAAEEGELVGASTDAVGEAEANTQTAAYPELLPTPQKGEGLSTLKRGLGLLFGLQDADLSRLPVEERREIQHQLERDSITSAIAKWRADSEKLRKRGVSNAFGYSSDENSISSQMGIWLEALEQRIKQEMVLVKMSEDKITKSEEDLDRCLYGPLIGQCNPSRLAAVILLSVLNLGAVLGADRGLAIGRLVVNIAKNTQEDLEMQRREEKERAAKKKRKITFKGDVADATKAAKQALKETTVLLDEVAQDAERFKEHAFVPWSVQVKVQLGSALLKMLLETARLNVVMEHPLTKEKLSQYQPAFSHAQQMRKGKKIGVIVLNPHLVTRLQREPFGDFLAKHLPMLVEPKEWESFSKGGFLDSNAHLVRVKPGDVEQKLYARAAINNGDMTQVFRGLDVLGKTAWIINKDILNVMLEAWNTGKEIANFPPLEPNLPVPPEPDSSSDPLLRIQWIKKVKLIENERSGLHSQRCFMNLQLEVARAFRNQTFYFPHNVDYRGRAYPMPTYLNHMGADHARAMLKFGKGKPLGARGLRWLKIHLANLYGFDKASFDEREAFADNNRVNIIESASNPLGGERWWLEAEDPWQCLATCFELKAALESPDPTQYVSHLPVHQDGTCNGLQHYAALGGDTWGARQVNLEPGERPADVYSAVANMVKEAISKDQTAGSPFAAAMVGKVTRKVVKQTVMTNVYGVTFAGAKKQVCKQLDALYPTLGQEVGIPNMILATYVARHIFTALATMFRGAHDIQYWLGDVGGRVCRALTETQLRQIADSYAKGDVEPEANKPSSRKAAKPSTAKGMLDELTAQFRSTVVWTTPLRMPVVQPYRKVSQKEIRTSLQSVLYPIGNHTDPVNRRKQLQGFPPNFIHSLDASHMLLSALECHDRGLDFAAVHDSFWTHAGDVDVLNEVLRDAFIRIHEEDVVGRLATEFEARHKGSIYLAHISADSPVAKKIRELRKESKLSPKEELLLEHKRNQLRLSGNPWDLELSKKIVTPASIYEDMAVAEEDVDIREDTKAIGLGEIPEEEIEGAVGPEAQEALMAAQQLASDQMENLLTNMAVNVVEANLTEDSKKKKKTPTRTKPPVPVWMPLTIPQIPKKGDFNVKRLRDSQYFFS